MWVKYSFAELPSVGSRHLASPNSASLRFRFPLAPLFINFSKKLIDDFEFKPPRGVSGEKRNYLNISRRFIFITNFDLLIMKK